MIGAASYSAALDRLPVNAEWSCSFGNPGSPGFNEYYRTPEGGRFVVSNGPWSECWRPSWTVRPCV